MILLAQGAALGFSSAAAPGPFQAYLLAQSLRQGWRRAAPLALVPLVSDPVVIGSVLALLTQVPPRLLQALGIAGGVFVLWLGASGLLALRRPAVAGSTAPAPRGFWRAALVNLTNPNAWLFWSIVGGPVLAEAWRTDGHGAAAFLAGFYVLLCGGNAVLILAVGAAGRLGPGVSRALGALSSVALLAFGAWQLGRGLAG